MISVETMNDNKESIQAVLRGIDRDGMVELIVALADSDFYSAPASKKYHLPIPGGLAQHSINVRRVLYRLCKYYYSSDPTKWPYSVETLDLVSLLHDVCKIETYILTPVEYITDKQLWKLNKEWSMVNEPKLNKDDVKRFKAYCYKDSQLRTDLFKEVASTLIDWLTKNPYNNPMPATPEEGPPTYNSVDPTPLGHGEKSLSYLQDFIKLSLEEKLAIRWHMGPWDISEYYGQKAFDIAKNTPLVNLLYIADYEASHIMDAMEG